MARKTEVKRLTLEEFNLLEVLRRYDRDQLIGYLDRLISQTEDTMTRDLLREMRLALKPTTVMLLSDLVENSVISKEDADYLLSEVSKGRNIAVTGKVRSGKTTLLHALISSLPPDRKIVIIENIEELDFKLSAPDSNIVKFVLGGNFSGDVLRVILQDKLDHLVFGEVINSDNALSLGLALLCGHPVMFTVHSDFSQPVQRVLMDKVKDGADFLRRALEQADFLEVACSMVDHVPHIEVVRS